MKRCIFILNAFILNCTCVSETFKKNHPDTPVFFQKVEDFIEESGPTPADFRKKHGKVPVVLFGSPCQSFSGANRDVDHNSEKDLYRKNLYLKLIDTMKVSDALIGLSENVEGIWRRPNVYFLKKSILDHLRAGYQVRVRLVRTEKSSFNWRATSWHALTLSFSLSNFLASLECIW